MYVAFVNAFVGSRPVVLRGFGSLNNANMRKISELEPLVALYGGLPVKVHRCIHTYIHTHIRTHTCIHTYIHAYIHTHTHIYTHTYMHTYLHTYIHTYIHICIHTYIPTYVYANIQHRSARPTHTLVGMFLFILGFGSGPSKLNVL